MFTDQAHRKLVIKVEKKDATAVHPNTSENFVAEKDGKSSFRA